MHAHCTLLVMPQALDYAFKMGAHIVSMSLGMNYPWMFAPDVPVSSVFLS